MSLKIDPVFAKPSGTYRQKLSWVYQLENLKTACVENLMASLKVTTCINTFIIVDRYLHADVKVKEQMVMFMICKVEQVVETGDWNKLMVSHPSLVTELTRSMGRRIKKEEKHACQFCLVAYGHGSLGQGTASIIL
eukprot:GFUD01119279.1.p1 GENE.GFUD01119279.1~~GFUD01119279.1.p1  ORF type:complete len:136 (-),score=27.56 GFUD01119279.1:76-483(-)